MNVLQYRTESMPHIGKHGPRSLTVMSVLVAGATGNDVAAYRAAVDIACKASDSSDKIRAAYERAADSVASFGHKLRESECPFAIPAGKHYRA